MIALLKSLYPKLPVVVRSDAASAYGYYLRHWRYGLSTDRLVDEALQRESWGAGDWDRYRQERLAYLLERAATRVPFYRAHWEVRRAAGDDADWLDLRNWPVLSKGSLHEEPHAFVADGVRVSRLLRTSTSGTTGSPITTYRSRRVVSAWYALFEARTRRWYGVDRHTSWAILGGQLVTPATQTSPPFWVWNAAFRQLYLSTMHLSADHAAAYVAALRKYRIAYLFGYASSMYWLAQMVREQGLQAPQLVVAVSNAEPLHPHQRELIGEVFGCPVRDTYGMVEAVAGGSECAHGVMHLWPDVGVVEVLEDESDAPVPPGSTGRLVCTGLLNDDMPLIRYDVGDRGALRAPSAIPCACGRLLPSFERIEGRSADNLITRDGRRVFWLNPVFYELPLKEAQIVQEDIGRLRVKLVTAGGHDAGVDAVIAQRLRERMGDVEVVIDHVDEIARGPNGKFQPVINLVAPTGLAPGASGA